MRATISFEADVAKVNDIMRSLVLEESNVLQDALLSLEKATTDRLVEGISEALEHVHSVATQLEQYRATVVSFEQAKFQTMLPQPAPAPPLKVQDPEQRATSVIDSPRALRNAVESMEAFNGFVEKMGAPATKEADSEQRLEEG